nr:uncharacterized protein LOC107281542 [Oryza sativa Japonica Group]
MAAAALPRLLLAAVVLCAAFASVPGFTNPSDAIRLCCNAGRNARRRRSPDDEEEDGDTSEEEEMDQIEMAQLEGNIRRPARGGRGGRRDRAAPSPRAAWGNLAPPWEPPSPAARTLREHRSRGRKEKQRKRKGRERR